MSQSIIYLSVEGGFEVQRSHNERRRVLTAGAASCDLLGAVKLHLQLAPAHLSDMHISC